MLQYKIKWDSWLTIRIIFSMPHLWLLPVPQYFSKIFWGKSLFNFKWEFSRSVGPIESQNEEVAGQIRLYYIIRAWQCFWVASVPIQLIGEAWALNCWSFQCIFSVSVYVWPSSNPTIAYPTCNSSSITLDHTHPLFI